MACGDVQSLTLRKPMSTARRRPPRRLTRLSSERVAYSPLLLRSRHATRRAAPAGRPRAGVCLTPHATCACARHSPTQAKHRSNHINTMWTTFAVHVAVAAAVLPRVHLTPGTVVARESIRAAAFMTADDNGLSQIVAQVQSNMNEGELSTRGEGWFVAQAFLVLGVLFAPAEPVAPAAELTVGLTAIASGLALGAAAVRDLGVTNLTPWPKPVESNQLQIEGVYSLCRHPMYSCLLSASFGEPHVV